MKIDIHVHTKKIKSGDSESRKIDPKTFCETILKTDVKICAITNHNHFDLTQFNSIVTQSKKHFQTWPGVELDVVEDGRKGHLIKKKGPKPFSLLNVKFAFCNTKSSID